MQPIYFKFLMSILKKDLKKQHFFQTEFKKFRHVHFTFGCINRAKVHVTQNMIDSNKQVHIQYSTVYSLNIQQAIVSTSNCIHVQQPWSQIKREQSTYRSKWFNMKGESTHRSTYKCTCIQQSTYRSTYKSTCIKPSTSCI